MATAPAFQAMTRFGELLDRVGWCPGRTAQVEDSVVQADAPGITMVYRSGYRWCTGACTHGVPMVYLWCTFVFTGSCTDGVRMVHTATCKRCNGEEIAPLKPP